MKKKAKVVVEVEYELVDGEMVLDDMKINRCDVEGDYKGVTLAMTTALAFGADNKDDSKNVFSQKLKLLRSTASAFSNCLSILRDEGAITEDDMSITLMDELSETIRHAVNLITLGVSKVLDIEKDYIDELNKTEYSGTNNDKDGRQESKQEGGTKQQGLESDDIESYL